MNRQPACMWTISTVCSLSFIALWNQGVRPCHRAQSRCHQDSRLSDRPGSGGRRGGGTIIATGTPEDLVKVPESYTGKYLKPILERDTKRTKELNKVEAAR